MTFSDIVGSRQYRWGQAEGLSVYRHDSNMANGNTYDLEGRMLTCEHATSRVVRTTADGSLEVLASHYEGKELNSPNDIVVKGDGAIYFTWGDDDMRSIYIPASYRLYRIRTNTPGIKLF